MKKPQKGDPPNPKRFHDDKAHFKENLPAGQTIPPTNNALSLRAEGDYVILEILANGVWCELIKERLDSAFSHIIEPIGIQRAIEKKLNEQHTG